MDNLTAHKASENDRRNMWMHYHKPDSVWWNYFGIRRCKQASTQSSNTTFHQPIQIFEFKIYAPLKV